MTATWKGKVAIGLVGVATTIASGYYSGASAVGARDSLQAERIRAIEVRQEEQTKAILSRLDDLKMDINGTRAEILNILKER
jgi:type II secretory pathway pseudopilin PulG